MLSLLASGFLELRLADEVVEALGGGALGRTPEIHPRVRRVPMEPTSVPGVGGPPRTVPGEEQGWGRGCGERSA